VRNLVQQDLVHLVIVEACREVPGDGDATLGKVAGARSALRGVEAERPRIIQVHANERVRPHAHPLKVRHGR